MNAIYTNENFKGEAATNVKTYINDVHICLLETIGVIIEEYLARYVMYQEGLYQFESNDNSNLQESQMNDLRDLFNRLLGDIIDIHDGCTGTMEGISDLVSNNLTSLESYTEPLTEAKTRLVNYRDATDIIGRQNGFSYKTWRKL